MALLIFFTAGSDVANIKTTAVRDGDHYIVNGSKKWITNAIWADYVTAAVRTEGPGAGGISLLIIPLKAPGVSTRRMFNSGVGASGSTFITFERGPGSGREFDPQREPRIRSYYVELQRRKESYCNSVNQIKQSLC